MLYIFSLCEMQTNALCMCPDECKVSRNCTHLGYLSQPQLLCSAARALARKLAEEKQAAVNAAKQAAEHSMDEEEIEAIRASVEQASTDAAREAARADALARAARQMGPTGSSQLFDLERLRVKGSSLPSQSLPVPVQ